MKVLLCEDVKKLGWYGDVVEVNEGYARNYLLPQGLAKVATENNIKAIAKEKAKRAEHRIVQRNRLVEAAKKVEGAEVVLAAKANEQGVLFGSITSEQVAANLRQQGFEVADDIVELPHHIKQVGAHSVTLVFEHDLTATVKVTIVPEGGIVENKEQEGQKIRSSENRNAGNQETRETGNQEKINTPAAY
ncbi:MAG: 50S ribosomal protein L9 [Sedimentisphaerales bacterium]|nr:50S ribosomal protein L9 [Sedimentisphaerales bacterium]